MELVEDTGTGEVNKQMAIFLAHTMSPIQLRRRIPGLPPVYGSWRKLIAVYDSGGTAYVFVIKHNGCHEFRDAVVPEEAFADLKEKLGVVDQELAWYRFIV